MTMKFTFWLLSAFLISLLSCMEIKAQLQGWKLFSQGIHKKDFTNLLKHSKSHKISKRNSDLKPFDEYQLKDHIEYIRVPTIFQTHFIRHDDLTASTTDSNNVDNIFKTNPKIQTMFNPEKNILYEYLKFNGDENQKSDETPALLTNYPSTIVDKNKSANDFELAELLKHLQQSELARKYQQPTYGGIKNVESTYEATLNHYSQPPAIDESQIENCKLGSTELCCSFQNNMRVFRNLCELIFHTELSGEAWQVEHTGACKNCNYACEENFEPLCASKNGLRYTIRNECLFNATICKHGEKDWKIIKKGICDENPAQQFEFITDKYETIPPDFRFTSSYKAQSNAETLTLTTIKENGTTIKESTPTTPTSTTPSSLTILHTKQPIKQLNITIVSNNAEGKTGKNNTKNFKLNLKGTNSNSTKLPDSENGEVTKVVQKKGNLSNNKTKTSNRRQQNKRISQNSRKPSSDLLTKLQNNNATTTETAPVQEKLISMYGTHEYSVLTALIKAHEKTKTNPQNCSTSEKPKV